MFKENGKALIVGFSLRSGVGAAKLLHKLGVPFAVWDSKKRKDLKPSFDKVKNLSFEFFQSKKIILLIKS